MSTPKRIAWKDIVTPPLNWKAPDIANQESESTENKNNEEEQGSGK